MPTDTSPTVLMVDDNPTNLQVLFKTLQPTGYRLLAARSGEEALVAALRSEPDLILLDIMMPPGIDGYQTIQRLKEEPRTRDVPVIFLSSLDETGNKVKGFELGAVDYIAKPFESAEVIARVRTHVRLQQLQADLASTNARMKRDLDAAGRVQQALLPKSQPECEGYDFGWACQSCYELGGDALDIFRIDDDTVGFYLLDVSGHGVSASLLAVTATRSLAPRMDRSSLVLEPGWDSESARPVAPSEVVRRLNVLNPRDSDRNPHFITMIYGVLDRSSGHVRYACAGHPGPIIIRASGQHEVVDAGSVPVGVLPDTAYEDLSIQLAPGDRLYLHSDGLYEQQNEGGQEYGRDRLRAALAAYNGDAMSSAETAVKSVLEWGSNVPVGDDLSVMALARHQ